MADDETGSAQASPEGAPDQEALIAAHEGRHGPLPGRILADLRSGAKQGGAVGAKAAEALGGAAEALNLVVVATTFDAPRALVGHALGMRLMLPAEGVHGPREAPALIYLFRDALAVRPTDDAPMSAIPLCGLHLVMPHVAMARWVYKAGRTAHANLGLEHEEEAFEESLASWTVDDFREADDKLQVFTLAEFPEPLHVYQHLGLVRISFELPGGRRVRMKSALPEPSSTFVHFWELFCRVLEPPKLSMEQPKSDEDRSEDAPH